MSTAPSSKHFADTKATLPADDRREHARFHLRLAITLRGDNNFYTGMTSDISEGGIFIATAHLLPIGTPVVLQFHMTRFDVDVTVRGTVRWIRTIDATTRDGEVFGGKYIEDVKPGMGVQFDEMPADVAQMIRTFMQVRSPEFFD